MSSFIYTESEWVINQLATCGPCGHLKGVKPDTGEISGKDGWEWVGILTYK